MNHDWHIEYEIPPLRAIYYTIVSAPTISAARQKLRLDRPSTKVVIRKTIKHLRPSMIERLEGLAVLMTEIATEMERYGKDSPEVVQHSHELLGASIGVKSWIKGLRESEFDNLNK